MRRSGQAWLPPYWEIIRFDAATFLTAHAGRGAQIYRDFLQPGLAEDLRHGFRAIAAGVVRQLQGAVRAQRRRSWPRPGRLPPYLVLITPGTGKYAREEREVTEACAARGLPMIRVLSDSREVQSDVAGPVLLTDMLTAGDHARVLALWLREMLRLGRWWLVRDRKARSLSVVAIPRIRQYYLDLAFARRIDRALWASQGGAFARPVVGSRRSPSWTS